MEGAGVEVKIDGVPQAGNTGAVAAPNQGNRGSEEAVPVLVSAFAPRSCKPEGAWTRCRSRRMLR